MSKFMYTLKRILKLIFNRIFYIIVALLLQLGWIFLFVWRLTEFSGYFSAALSFLSLVIILVIANKRINPSFKLSWTVAITTIPVFGLVLYLLFGQSRIAKEMQRRFDAITTSTQKYRTQKKEVLEELQAQNPSVAVQAQYLIQNAGYPLWRDTIAEYFPVGDDMFPVLLRELKKAEHFIFLEYFIIHDGEMWNQILEVLEEKATAGVDVRLIYDGFGCLASLPNKYYEIMRKKGISCYVFNRFRPVLNIIQNNRDHRKICVIDGHTGFTGGINFADEYINQKKRFGHWKDTAVMLRGEAVWNMTLMFLDMWRVVSNTKDPIAYEAYMPHRWQPDPFEGNGFFLPFADSPLDTEIVSENTYLNIINRAKRYVYICTPYLVIDNEIMTALCLAAKGGIDVRVMTPGIPDKKTVFLLSQSYYQQLLEAGVKVYEYQPGFLHAKSFVCDDEVGVVGTINLDYRSLYLHFEDGVWIYQNHVIQEIRMDFLETLDYCRPVTLEFCRGRSILVRIFQNLLRLVAPLL